MRKDYTNSVWNNDVTQFPYSPTRQVPGLRWRPEARGRDNVPPDQDYHTPRRGGNIWVQNNGGMAIRRGKPKNVTELILTRGYITENGICKQPIWPSSLCYVLSTFWGHGVAKLVQALCYKPEGPGFDSRWGYWIFQLQYGPGVSLVSNTNK
jgi:hypothetical protein